MAHPTEHPTTEVVYAWLGPGLTGPDEDNGWALLQVVDAYGAQVGVVDEVVRGSDGRPGWASALDPDTAPVAGLGWLAQFPGVNPLPDGLTEAQQRARIANPAGWRRGTPLSIRQAVAETLIGGRTVQLVERDGSAYLLTVTVYTAEMPSQAATEAVLARSKPAGIIATLTVMPGQSWADLIAGYATWADVIAAYPTWQDVIEDIP